MCRSEAARFPGGRRARAALAALATGLALSVSAQTPAEGQTAYGRGDYATALRIFGVLAEQGDADAAVRLGLMYAGGHGVPRDDAEAVRWYRKAAEQGNAWGETNLGYMYAQGRGVARDAAEAVSWYRKAAAQNFAMAQDNLGVMYRDGRGVAADETAAVEWFRKAAARGYAEGQNNLGWMYARGRGVARDWTEAVAWYRKAADQGQARAQTNLASMYEEGKGVDRDDAEAARWYRKAADQDFPAAQIGLGQMYETGRGVARDLAEAKAWYRKAANAGNPRARTFLSSLENRGRNRVAANCLVQIAEWPVQAVADKLIVDGVVNGRKIGVAVDTGASATMMLQSQATRLGLEPVAIRGYVEGVGGISEMGAVRVGEIMIGDATRRNWTMPVVAAGNVGSDAAVFLGEDFFGRVDVEFDLAHDAIRLYEARGCGDASLAYWTKEGATEVEFDTGYFRRPQIRLAVRVNGRPVNAILDSGAAVSILDAAVAARLGLTPDAPGVRPAGSFRGAGKDSVRAWIGPVETFAVGGETIRDTAITFADIKQEVLLLGADFLRAHRVLVAHSQKKLHFSYVGGPVFSSDRLPALQDAQPAAAGTAPAAENR